MAPQRTGLLRQRSVEIPARIIATCFALIGFAAAVVVGAVAGNRVERILARALVTMGLCWALGRVIGGLAQRGVDREIDAYRAAHPISDEHRGAGDPDHDGEQSPARQTPHAAEPAASAQGGT